MKAIPILILAGIVGAGPASAQSTPNPNSVASLEAGYAGSGRVATRPFNPSTRDANGNRLVLNGVIVNGQDSSTVTYTSAQSGRPSGAGADYLQTGAGSTTSTAGATAIGNLVSVSITGHGNTVVLNSRQDNSGAVSASGRRP